MDAAIIAAGHAELAEFGRAGMQLDRIAQRAGVARTTIYRRHRDLDGVLRLMVDDLYEPLPLADTGSVRTDLIAMIDKIVEIWSDPARVRLLALVAEPAEHNVLRNAYLEHFVSRREDTTQLLRRAVERGELEPATDVDLILDVIAGVIAQRTLLLRIGLHRGLAEQLADLVLTGCGRR